MAKSDAMLFAGASSALDLMSGLFGYLAAQDSADAAASRARMIRLEAETDAQRYSEMARGTLARTKLAYLKSGVDLSGSPLDVLDHDILTAQENISAIRAGGAANALNAENQGIAALSEGRSALLRGITGGVSNLVKANYQSSKTSDKGSTNRKNDNYSFGKPGYASSFLQSEGWAD